MPLTYRALTEPSVEPVSVLMAKQHLRIDFSDDDAYIAALITAARQYVERKINMAIFNRQMLLSLDAFPWPGWDNTVGASSSYYYMAWYYKGLQIALPFPRAVSLQSIKYLLNDGVTWETLPPTQYIVDLESEPARISPVPSGAWPYQSVIIPGQVQVNYTAGTFEKPVTEPFTAPADAPYTYALKQAANLVTFTGVTDANNNPVAVTEVGGTITVPESAAGQSLTANYTVNATPQSIVFAILLLIGHWYNNREDVSSTQMRQVPRAVDSLLAPFVRMTLW